MFIVKGKGNISRLTNDEEKKMEITNVDIKELKANDKNPRKITKRELTK